MFKKFIFILFLALGVAFTPITSEAKGRSRSRSSSRSYSKSSSSKSFGKIALPNKKSSTKKVKTFKKKSRIRRWPFFGFFPRRRGFGGIFSILGIIAIIVLFSLRGIFSRK